MGPAGGGSVELKLEPMDRGATQDRSKSTPADHLNQLL